MLRSLCYAVTTLLLLVAATAPAAAGSLAKTVPFALDEWFDLDASDGPVTLHRLRIERQSGGFTKSKVFRPGNDEFLQTIQIQLEFSNSATKDWEADIDINWSDVDGTVIDGYRDDEGLDDDESHDTVTVTLSTLRYGLDRAKTLDIKIEFDPD